MIVVAQANGRFEDEPLVGNETDLLRRTGCLPCRSTTTGVVGDGGVGIEGRAGIEHRDKGIVIGLAHFGGIGRIGFGKVIGFLGRGDAEGIGAAVDAQVVEVPGALDNDARTTGHLHQGRRVNMGSGGRGAQVHIHIEGLAGRRRDAMGDLAYMGGIGGRIGLQEVGHRHIGGHGRIGILHGQVFLEAAADTAAIEIPGRAGGCAAG